MANQFSKTRIATAVSAAALGVGLSAPAGAVVVVGGNDGWEVSFDGNVNAFYTVGDFDAGYVTETADKDSGRVTSGYLPAFFSFNVKTPTIGGMTGTGRISFAPVIHTSGSKTNFASPAAGGLSNYGPITGISGSQIDTREVLANLSGAFGELSFGRTLSLFGRNAILNDMTLFGVGFVPGADQYGSVTFGRTGHGYTYPDFTPRFQYTTPVIAGVQAAIGMFDPSTIDRVTVNNFAAIPGGLLDETDSPRFEGELSYSTAFNGGTAKMWVDGTWQDVDSSCTGASTAVTTTGATVKCGKMTSQAWGAGAKLGYMGFEFVGYYHDNSGLGLTAQFTNWGVQYDANGNIQERDGHGYYVQGMYNFSGKTKVGVSYGEGVVDAVGTGNAAAAAGFDGRVERSLWTVGVYHDVSSWLRFVAEYNHGRFETNTALGTPEADTFSVGGFLFW